MAKVTKRIEETSLKQGAAVRVTDGPFKSFRAVVESVNYETSKAVVAVQMLGRSTRVELDFNQFVSTNRVPAA